MPWSMDSPSFPLFFLQTLKTIFQLLPFALLTSITVTLTLGKIRGLAFCIPSCKFTLSVSVLLCLVATSPTTPTLAQKGKWVPQQNCDQNQSSCLEVS